MEKIVFLVQGMTCESCRGSVEKALALHQGVSDIHVSLVSHQASFFWDAQQTSLEVLQKSLSAIGYKAEIYQEDSVSKDPFYFSFKKILSLLFLSLLLFVIPYIDFNTLLVSYSLQIVFSSFIIFTARHLLKSGFFSLIKRQPNMFSLVMLGSLSGYFYSLYQVILFLITKQVPQQIFFDSSSFIISIVLLGNYLEDKGKQNATRGLKDLFKTQSSKAHKINSNGKMQDVSVENLKIGDFLLIKVGEKIPVDGVIVKGKSEIDESLITGEAWAVLKKENDEVVSGSYNKSHILTMKVTKTVDKSFLMQMIQIMESIQSKKVQRLHIVDVISAYFIKGLLGLGVIVFVFWYIKTQSFVFALKIFITVLVASCPCAIGLAAPIAIATALSRLSKEGILVLNAQLFYDRLKIDHAILDKTGTLTQGKSAIKEYSIYKAENKNYLLSCLYTLQSLSDHPVAKVFKNFIESQIDSPGLLESENVEQIPAEGLRGIVDGKMMKISHSRALESVLSEEQSKMDQEASKKGNLMLYLTVEGSVLGHFVLEDPLRKDASLFLSFLNEKQIQPSLLSGDKNEIVEFIASKLGIEDYRGELKPEDKWNYMQDLQKKGSSVMMLGDGVNDVLALSQSDLGICMGLGSDISLKASDVILMSNKLESVAFLFKMLDKTYKIIKQNLVWAFSYNIFMLPLASGILYLIGRVSINPTMSILGMSLSTLCVILNSLRLLRVKK